MVGIPKDGGISSDTYSKKKKKKPKQANKQKKHTTWIMYSFEYL